MLQSFWCSLWSVVHFLLRALQHFRLSGMSNGSKRWESMDMRALKSILPGLWSWSWMWSTHQRSLMVDRAGILVCSLKILRFTYFHFTCMGLYHTCTCLHHVYAFPMETRRQDLILWNWSFRCGCWKLNRGPLQKQLVLLTSEPPLQPQVPHFNHKLTKCAYFLRHLVHKSMTSEDTPSFSHVIDVTSQISWACMP